MEPVRWGVLSTSSFAEGKFLPGLRKTPLVDVVAVASRDAQRAADFATRNDIARSYGSYDEMLGDPSVEVVYNALPNHLHVEWTRRCAEAGKHVLCEKPMGLTATEIESLLPLADRVHVAEGFMVRFHPQWSEVRERVRAGEIGRLTHAHVAFAYTNTDPTNIRNIAEVGGGALYDIGCYAVVAARWFFEAEPARVAAVADVDPTFATDRLTSALLDFGDGRVSQFSVSTQSTTHQRVHLFGTAGRIEITIPFNQPQDTPVVYFVDDGKSGIDGLFAARHEVGTADQYTLQAEAFSRRVREGTPDGVALRDAIANARVLDAIRRASRTGGVVAV